MRYRAALGKSLKKAKTLISLTREKEVNSGYNDDLMKLGRSACAMRTRRNSRWAFFIWYQRFSQATPSLNRDASRENMKTATFLILSRAITISA